VSFLLRIAPKLPRKTATEGGVEESVVWSVAVVAAVVECGWQLVCLCMHVRLFHVLFCFCAGVFVCVWVCVYV
jgi:hypothetical protein